MTQTEGWYNANEGNAPEVIEMAQVAYTTEEVARKGRELFEREVRPRVETGNRGKIVMIDIETGTWELGDDDIALSRAMLAKRPGAALYAVRIGYPGVVKIGGSWGAAGR